MLIRPAASSTGVVLLAAAATAAGFACSFPVDEFRKGSAVVKPDSALDSFAPDTVVTPDSRDSSNDSANDSTIVVEDTDGGADSSEVADTAPEVDTGPPTPETGCTLVGPTETICIPATTFSVGAANPSACAPSGCASELPRTSVKVSQFFIDQHEVTVKRFRAWWNATPRSWPAAGATFFSSGAKDYKWRNTWPTAPTEPPIGSGCTWAGAMVSTNDDLPMNCVDWYTALAFCMSEGKRLPSEVEWELVASGGEDRLFPWSWPGTEDDPFAEPDVNCTHALRGKCTPLTDPPTSTIWGRDRWGVWNLSGSLAEWTLDAHTLTWSGISAGSVDPLADPTTATGNNRMIRGGSHMSSSLAPLRAAARPPATLATGADSAIGFRCAKR